MVTRTLISRLVQDISHLYPAKNVKDLIKDDVEKTYEVAQN